MRIKRGAWIFVAVVLWGMPVGLLLSFVLAIFEVQPILNVGSDAFIGWVCLLVPCMSAIGVVVGITLDNLAKKTIKDEQT